MSLLEFLIYLVVGGFVFYLVDTYIPMPPAFKTVLRVVAVVVLILLVLALVGLMPFPRVK